MEASLILKALVICGVEAALLLLKASIIASTVHIEEILLCIMRIAVALGVLRLSTPRIEAHEVVRVLLLSVGRHSCVPGLGGEDILTLYSARRSSCKLIAPAMQVSNQVRVASAGC